MSPAAVAMHGISRRFGPVLANDDVAFELAPGEIHALVGENGAGKTTLMRILSGLLAPDAGRIELDGRPVRLLRPLDAMRAGIGMVHQHFLLVDTLTVAENVTLGHEAAGWTGALDRAAAERSVDALGRRYGLPVDAHERVGALPVGLQQRVEILKVLARGARVLVLDEPTAVLTPQEVEELFGVLRALRDGGTSIVLITHKLGEVVALAERVTVLRGGRVVGGGRVADLSIGRIAELMVGRTIPELQPRAARATGDVAIAAVNLGVRDDRGLDAVRALSFEVRAGEIVGLAGVEGNGQHELVECLAGIRPAVAGEVRIGGLRPARATPRAHAEAGLAHIPSDRLRRGLVPQMTLAENLALGRHLDPALGRGPWLSKQSLAEHARGLLEEYDVRPAEPSLRAAQLSGGNQQKLIAARELSKRAPAVIAAHPTRGVDLGAVDFLHRRLLAERDRGAGVLLVSSELSEILALADRILVMHAGRLTLETRPADTDERALGLAMAGRPGSAA